MPVENIGKLYSNHPQHTFADDVEAAYCRVGKQCVYESVLAQFDKRVIPFVVEIELDFSE